jgi:hypothetical protein
MKTTVSRTLHSPLVWLAVAILVFSGTLPAEVIPGRYIAVLKAETRDTPGAAKALAAQHNLDVDHVYTRAIKGFAFAGSEQAAQALARRAEIAYVEPDQVCLGAGQTIPTGIRRCAASAVPGLIGGGLMVDADVAVIDTGLDGTHPDLNVMPDGVRFYMAYDKKLRRDVVRSDGNWQDDNGHGTHVGGIIGAKDNDIGVVGVAPGVRLWPVKVLDANGAGTASTVIAGIDWVVQRVATFEVANLSLALRYSQAVNDAVKAGTQAGIVFVVAAGDNAWRAVEYSPASEPTALTVSAVDDNDGLPGGLGGLTDWIGLERNYDDWLFFNSNYGEGVDVCAPGGAIYSTYLTAQGGYKTLSGTSMAAAHGAGAAALYIGCHGLTKSATGVEAVCAAIRDSGWQAGHYAHFCDSLYWISYHEGVVFDTAQEPLLNVANLLYRDAAATVSFSAPTDATKVAGNATLQVTTSAAGATAMQFYLDGELIGEDANGADGWAVTWDTTTSADGPRTLVAVATDGAAQLAGDAIVIGVNNAGGAVPWVYITGPFWPSCFSGYEGEEVVVTGQIEVTAYAVDLGGVSAVDFFCGETFIGAGTLQPSGDWSLVWDCTTVPDGISELIAVATGAAGSIGLSAPVPIKVVNRAIHIGDLDGTSSLAGGQGQWAATIWVTVHDWDHHPVAGTTVSGSWSIGGAATPQVTDANGICVFTSNLIKKTSTGVRFTVTGVTPPSELEDAPYDKALSHDPDGDSDGRSIWVWKP